MNKPSSKETMRPPDSRFDLRVGADTPADRVRAWQTLLHDNLMGVECLDAGEDLRAAVEGCHVRSGSITRSTFTRQTMSRTPDLIRHAADETFLLGFVQDGIHHVRQGTESATLEGSGIYVLDASRPFEVDFASPAIRQTALIVPKTAITRRVGALEEIAFDHDMPLQALVSNFALGTSAALDTLDAATLDALLGQTLDLFALMVAQRRRGVIAPSTHRAGTLLRIKSYVKAHLHDETLSLARTAAALGISERYVNALLATEGTSFGRHLLAERLDGARRQIMDPRLAHKQVTEIAFDWGFQSTTHFGRAFKERFGLTPRDARTQEP